MRNLAPARRDSYNRRRSAVLFDALEPRALFAATPTTTTLTLSAPVLAANQPLTLTAAVSADPGSPALTGTVAFFEVVDFSKNSYYFYDSNDLVTFANSSTAGLLLGTAPLAADGTASLALPSIPSSSAVYTGQFRAVFLGADTPFSVGRTNNVGIATSVAFADPGQTLGPADAHPAFDTPASQTTKYYLLFPQGHPLAVHDGQITVLSDLPDGVTPRDPSAALYLFDDNGTQTFYVAPSTTPLLVHTSVGVTSWWQPWGTSYNYSYSTSFVPVPSFTHAFDANADFGSSLSPVGTPAADQPTTLNISTSGPFTYTNPPAITVSLANPNGGSYSRHAPNPAPRGDYQQAHAGVDVQVSTGTGAYGLFTSGGTSNGSSSGGNPTPAFVPPGPYPTGTVSFFDEDNTLLGTAPLDADGNATFYPDPRSLPVGTHSIHAVYSGDAVYHAADASTAPFTLARAATTLSISGLFDTVYSGVTLSLRAGVQTTTRDTVTPTGTFTFLVDGQAFATLPALPGPPASYGGSPSQLTLTLPPGTHTLTVTYSGDADFLASSSTANFTVLVRPVSDPPDTNIYSPFWGAITDVAPSTLSPGFLPSHSYAPGDAFNFDVSILYTGVGRPNTPTKPVAFALSLDDVAGNSDDIPLAVSPTSLYILGFLNFDSAGHTTLSYSYAGTLPGDLPAGNYHVVAIADPDHLITETDETNNALVSSWAITVVDQPEVFTPVPTQPTPVLITPDLAGTLTPARPTATVNAPASLKLTLTNPSKTRTVARKYAVTYYLSTDATFSDDDTKFSKQVINVNLGKKQTKSYALNYKLPATAPLGTRYLIAVADLADGLPSITSGVTVASSKPLKILGPHLAATVRSVIPTNRADTVKVTVRVLNDGSATFAGPATLRLLSDTSTPSTLLTARKSVTLKAGKYADYTFTVRRPAAGATLSVTVA